ncbi:MAG: nitroreductase family protein [Prolixibacteraceae bacterium]|nr:nitroreductase family protein [Prolixibacteraceae bacterium]
MSIPTSRTEEMATVTIDQIKCNGCGKCVTVCSDYGFKIINGKAVRSEEPLFGCLACGHCMAVCPENAIDVTGRCLTPDDLFPFTEPSVKPDYNSLLQLFQARRSMRKFKDQPVSREIIDLILAAAQTAPMGVPPSDVNVVVLQGKEKVRQFSSDFCSMLDKNRWLVSRWITALMTLFYDRKTVRFFKKFMRPLFDIYIGSMKKGIDLVTYDAPVAFYFYGSPYCDPADPIVAATYAMTAAESLGLGSCMLGAIHPFLQSGFGVKEFRSKYNIRFKSREGLVLIVGYPKVKYARGVRRSFANIDFI